MSDHTDTDNDTKEPGASPEGLNPAGTPAPASDNTIPTVKLDEELKGYLDAPADTPAFVQA